MDPFRRLWGGLPPPPFTGCPDALVETEVRDRVKGWADGETDGKGKDGRKRREERDWPAGG